MFADTTQNQTYRLTATLTPDTSNNIVDTLNEIPMPVWILISLTFTYLITRKYNV